MPNFIKKSWTVSMAALLAALGLLRAFVALDSGNCNNPYVFT